MRILAFVLLSIFVAACHPATEDLRQSASSSNVFMLDEIENNQVNFVWFEFPPELQPGTNEVRVFMARTDPPGMLVPMETELPCLLQAEDGYLEFGPIPMQMLTEDSRFEGSYSWHACASCIDCYMDWETRMELDGEYLEDSISIKIGIRHMGHNLQDTYLSLSVPKSVEAWNEPRIACKSPSDCQPIRFEQID